MTTGSSVWARIWSRERSSRRTAAGCSPCRSASADRSAGGRLIHRAVLDLDDLRVTRSLRQATRRYEIRVDTVFDQVIRACGDPKRPKGWIEGRITNAYTRLFDLGWVHSVEAFEDGRLVGGLYGVAIGGLFAGESMFHHARDASKVALVALVELLREGGNRLLDVQWLTPHLASLGACELDRSVYLTRLENALSQPLPARWV